jgi:hypothetical protein
MTKPNMRSLCSVDLTRLLRSPIAFATLFAIFAIAFAYYLYVPPLTSQTLMPCIVLVNSIHEPDEDCTKALVKRLLQNYSAGEILAVADARETPNAPETLTANCHAIGHIVGAELVQKTGTLEGALAQCTNACDNGCTHGAVAEEVLEQLGEEYSDQEVEHASIPQIEKIGSAFCAQSPTVCHGIGHVLQIELGDFRQSLSVCEKIATGTALDGCYQGVFMESFGGEFSVEFASTTIAAPPNDLAYPCSSLAQQYQHDCFRYLPALLEQRFPGQNIAYLSISSCERFRGEERQYCFEGVGHTNAIRNDSTQDAVVESTCASVLPQDSNSCILGLAEKYLDYNDTNVVTELCGQISDPTLKNDCLLHLQK